MKVIHEVLRCRLKFDKGLPAIVMWVHVEIMRPLQLYLLDCVCLIQCSYNVSSKR